ncbi:MAG TPA: lipid-A-disaccharide synthase [Acidobacteriaceae bacterium]|jgi:lipid-A-disaccharide synthase|nr:lipid-A-disaccharide synthase [Acidobacteriaceae bacterium]
MGAAANPLIFLSAGEASGERYGAALMDAIRRRLPEACFFGLGGAAMTALGFRPVVRAEDVAHMGITEVVRHAPYIYGQFQRLKRAIAAERPALAVLIDFPDVNLRLAEQLHRYGVPVVYFVSPQLWAWKKRRIRRVQRFVDRMLVIFPFEEPFYRERGVAAEFVGHPLADLAAPEVSREEFARQHGLDASKAWVALLPGSRQREVDLNLPTMLEAATILDSTMRDKKYEYLLPVAPTLKQERIEAAIAARRDSARPVLVHDARAALFHARGSVVASGTATVEAALVGNPFVVVYRLSKLSYAIARRFVSVPHVAMANLIAGRRVVPELIQNEFTAANVVRALTPLLADGPAREETMAGLREVRERLETRAAGETAIARVARICVDLLAGGDAEASDKKASKRKASGREEDTGPSNTRGEPEASTLPAGTYQA